MTKKDFIAIALVLDANQAPLALVQDFADMLEEQNERFNRSQFIRASTENLFQNSNREVAHLIQQRVLR